MNTATLPAKEIRVQNALIRSHIEICRILQELATQGVPVTAEIGEGLQFKSRILHVDPDASHLIVAYSSKKSLNSELLGLHTVEFTATNRQDAHFEFKLSGPAETQFDDQPAIQFVLPETLILFHRREHPRIPVPAEASLRCVADAAGFAPFESHITDISHDGLGGIIYDPDIKLAPGTLLRGCRIIVPAGSAISADLEVRYVRLVTLPDGTVANRAGFRFIQRPDEIPDLINYFIQDLGQN